VAKIIGVSEYGASEVVRAFGLPRARVTSIHHGVDHDVYTASGEREKRDRPYFLHVSSYQRKKNVERILAAHQSLPAGGRPDLVLVCPGAPKALGAQPGVTLIDTGLAPKELAPWYRGALAFLFPSLHETFGMPILEAMACGCPVLTSNTTACPEAAGNAALFVDPRAAAALFEGLERLIADAGLRARLAESGLAHAARFDWQTCADRHLDVFRRAAGEPR
jgi:glycosyltransferase involved in cell wall biosynthesis